MNNTAIRDCFVVGEGLIAFHSWCFCFVDHIKHVRSCSNEKNPTTFPQQISSKQRIDFDFRQYSDGNESLSRVFFRWVKKGEGKGGGGNTNEIPKMDQILGHST